MQDRTKPSLVGTCCYALVALLLIASLFFGWFRPANVSKLSLWMKTPTDAKIFTPAEGIKSAKLKVAISHDQVTLNGEAPTAALAARYEMVLMPMGAYALEGSDPAAWFATQTPAQLTTRSIVSLGGKPGDVLYVRLADADEAQAGAQPATWSTVRLDGEYLSNALPEYSAFNLNALLAQVEAFLVSPTSEGTFQPANASSMIEVLRIVAPLMPWAAGLALALLMLFLAAVLFAPALRKLTGSIALIWTALVAGVSAGGLLILNEILMAREIPLLADGTIKWSGWTGSFAEPTVMAGLCVGLSLIALFTLYYSRKDTMHLMVRNWQLYLMLVPAIVLFAIFAYGPMFGATLSFKEFHAKSTIQQMPWVGLRWFVFAFKDPMFLHGLQNSIILSALHFLFGFPAPILLALLLNEVYNAKFKRVVQTVSFMPQFLSWVVIGSIFIGLLSMDGPVNQFLMLLGMKKPIHFLGDPQIFRTTLIFTNIWKGVGYSSVIFLAAISGVDPQLYECAKLDGSSRLQNMWYITLPSISNIVIIMLILRLGSIIEAGFDQIVNMYNPTVYATSDIIDTYIYRKTFFSTGGGQAFDYTSAIGLFKSVVSLIFIVGSNLWVRRAQGKEAALW